MYFKFLKGANCLGLKGGRKDIEYLSFHFSGSLCIYKNVLEENLPVESYKDGPSGNIKFPYIFFST